MTVFLINIFLIIVFGFFFIHGRPSWRNKKLFCILATSQWVLLSGLRHVSVGVDTFTYEGSFRRTLHQTWGHLFENFLDSMFGEGMVKDPGYNILEKVFQIFSTNFQLYLIFIALVMTVPFGIWIYKNSKEPVMSFLIYSCLFGYSASMIMMRNTIAMSLVVFTGYKYIKERRFWPFLALAMLALTIHRSAIIFLPFYFLANKKITRSYLMSMSAIVPIIFFFRNKFIIILTQFAPQYEGYRTQFIGAGAWNYLTLMTLIFIVSISRLKIMMANNIHVTHYINALLMSFIFMPLGFISPAVLRVSLFYAFFITLLIPEIFDSLTKEDRKIVYYVAFAVLLTMYIRITPEYLFFWQGW